MYGTYVFVRDGLPPTHREARDTFLEKKHVSYGAYAWLRDHHIAQGPAYSLFEERMHYFSPLPLLGDWFGPARYRDAVGHMESAERLHRYLRALGVRYLIANLSYARESKAVPRGEAFDILFELLAEGPSYGLWKLRDITANRAFSRQEYR